MVVIDKHTPHISALSAVEPADELCIRVTWKDGPRAPRTELVDLSPLINSLKIFKPLRDNRSLFETVHLLDDEGDLIAWGDDDELDMDSEAIERLASEMMTWKEFKVFLHEMNYTQGTAAAMLGYSRRQIANFASGDQPIPRVCALACAALKMKRPAQPPRYNALWSLYRRRPTHGATSLPVPRRPVVSSCLLTILMSRPGAAISRASTTFSSTATRKTKLKKLRSSQQRAATMFLKADGYTIFCDDIRQEVGNKTSLMGIYGAELNVHQPFPVTMRMGFYIVLKEDPRAPLKDMTLCLYFPGDVDGKPGHKVDLNRSDAELPQLPKDIDPTARRTLNLNLVVAVPLKEPGKIKVRMIIDDEEVRLGTLNIKQAELASTK